MAERMTAAGVGAAAGAAVGGGPRVEPGAWFGAGAGAGFGAGRVTACEMGRVKGSEMGLETKFSAAGGPALGAVIAGEAGAGGRVIEGYASLFGQVDQGGDLVEPGAYAAGLARLSAQGGRVKMLWQHDPARPIGIWDEVREDGRGLWVRGRLLSGVALAEEAAVLVAAGALDGLSIGYRTLRAAKGVAPAARRLLELELWEVSLVTFPMLPTARLAGGGVAAKGEAAPGEAAPGETAKGEAGQAEAPQDWLGLAGALDAARRALEGGR